MTPKCPDCKMDQDDCICASPASAPEGWKIPEPMEHEPLRADEPMQVQVDMYHYVKGWNACREAMLAAAPTPPASEDQKDAERYRWLRDIGNNTWEPMIKRGTTATQCDSAIDAGIVATQEDKKP